jgi:hypothetical protein
MTKSEEEPREDSMPARMVALMPVLTLVLGAAAACQPAGERDYSTVYRPAQLDRVATASLLDATPAEIAAARGRDQAIYEAELARQRMLAGSLSAQQSARRGAQLLRQQQSLQIAQREAVWAQRDLARQQRELRSAEWLDREPVFTGPYDRPDALRRQERTETRRALDRAQQAQRRTARAADRLDRQSAAGFDLERMRVMDRIDRRQAERESAAQFGPPDPLQRWLPYRRQGESVEALRTRVEAAEARSVETGASVEGILREQRD